MFANGDCCPTASHLVRLYIHEANRVYGDKMVNFEDQDLYNKLVLDNIRKNIENLNENMVFETPCLYFHYAEGLSDSKYMPVKSWKTLNTSLVEAQVGYNELIGAMNLVLFEDAMAHICRLVMFCKYWTLFY